MNVKSINDRIIEAADKELRDQIDAAAKPLDSLLRNGCAYSVIISDERDAKMKLAEVPWYRALHALREKAFELRCEDNRNCAIAAFVSKVGQLDQEMEELRQMSR